MAKQKIAVLTDSGNDIIKGSHENLFIVPLLINIGDKSYIDGVDITLDEVLDVIDDEKITTSLPNADIFISTLDEIKEKGYTHVIINTISSALSGTYNFIRLLTSEYEGLKFGLIDTKNISVASGYTAYLALELIEQGKEFEEIIETLNNSFDNHKVFFTVGTVEYLRKGGRIGKVAGAVANLLNIKPVITCDETGVYHAVSKTRGYQKAIQKMTDLALNFINKSTKYDITVLVARLDERTREVIGTIKEVFAKATNFDIKSITPALAIHTGPQALGIALRKRK